MTHYEVLEISPGSPAADIRRAYRRLVLLTHPDRTSDPVAHARYLTINAAYETLSDPARRQAYDWTLRNPAPAAPTPSQPMSPGKARDARYRSTRQSGPTQKAGTASYEAGYYYQYAPVGRLACKLLVLFALLLGADRLFVLTYLQEKVVAVESRLVRNRRGQVSGQQLTIITPHASFQSEQAFDEGDTLDLRRTPLFRQVVSAQLSAKSAAIAKAGEEYYYRLPNTIYSGAGLLLPLIMLITAAVGAWPGKVGRRQVDCALTAGILAVIVLVLLLRS